MTSSLSFLLACARAFARRTAGLAGAARSSAATQQQQTRFDLSTCSVFFAARLLPGRAQHAMRVFRVCALCGARSCESAVPRVSAPPSRQINASVHALPRLVGRRIHCTHHRRCRRRTGRTCSFAVVCVCAHGRIP